MLGKLVSFEGIDNCGKGTQVAKLEEYLKSKNISVMSARDPGSSTLAEALRIILKQPEQAYELLSKHPDFKATDLKQRRNRQAETMMFMAARADYVEHVIKTNLKNGISVISDRLADSTRAYQGGGRYGSDPGIIYTINRMNRFVMQKIAPDKTFYLDIEYEDMVAREEDKNAFDYFERSGKDFYNKIIKEYRNIAKENPGRVVMIDGRKSIDDIFQNDILPEARKIWGNI